MPKPKANSTGHNEDPINNLYKEVQKYVSLAKRSSKPCLVGAYGVAGSGKSHSINNLLGEPQAAFTSDDVGSATHIVHEFAAKTRGQTAKYRKLIEFLSIDEIEHEITAACASFYRRAIVDIQSRTSVEQEELKKASTSAMEFLASITVERGLDTAFNSKDDLTQFLRTMNNKRGTTVIRAFLDKANDYLDSLSVERVDRVKSFEANTLEALNAAVQSYISCNNNPNSGEELRSPWYVIKQVKTYFDAILVNDGSIIADLPGLEDTNKKREKNALD